jgi:diguanylate cyclase (GGDEF)-like protein
VRAIRRIALGTAGLGAATAGVALARWTPTPRARRHALERQVRVLSAAVAELTKLRHADEVVDAAVRLAADMISPEGNEGRRALYFEVDGEHARVVAQSDESARTFTGEVALADHAALAEVVRTLRPVQTAFASDELGDSARLAVEHTRVTHGAAVPIVVEGALHGVLAVGGRGGAIAEFDRLVDLGGVVELALANALVTEELERQATTDPLTGCANRRGLELAAQLLSNRQPFAVVVADLDGLKELNDREGHHAGDLALWRFADVVGGLLRTGDVLARVGGDEFLVLLNNTDESGARALANRIAARMEHPDDDIRVSLGIASATGPAVFDETCRRADEAMYGAKRQTYSG